jgi:acetoacetyl-CoA synthetase
MNPILWEPSSEQIETANITRLIKNINAEYATKISGYSDLHDWSINNPEAFWQSFWVFTDIKADKGKQVLENQEQMIDAKWFSDSKLNFSENLLRFADKSPDQIAIKFWGEDKVKRQLSQTDLKQQVASVVQFLRDKNIQAGDVVAGFMPNMPESVVCMLATASIGAIWTSCSPDFGVQGVLDRFGQVKPKIFISADAYYYNGKTHDCLAKVAKITEALDSIQQVIIVPYAGGNTELEDSTLYTDILNQHSSAKLKFTRLLFNSPLYIMYSSGTTGVPKCIVHGIGGTLLQQLKEQLLHVNLKPQDKIFYFTTCGWMMWNWLVSALATGATLMLYDGSPFYPDANILLDYAEQEQFTVFGTSAKYIDVLRKESIDFTQTHQLKNLKSILSTGSVLCPESYDYVYENIKQDVCLSSISGGTDILSCFALGAPTLPVRRGELQCKGLGMQVEIWDSKGNKVKSEKGELVCIKPFPSMPLYFWNDPDSKKYHDAYFASFENIWCHGDYVEETDEGGLVFYGRSDTVLNPGGVRIGTAEIYRQVERMEEVQESIVIGQQWQDDVRVVLFVKLANEYSLDDELIQKIKNQIRSHTTPRHVPAKVLQVEDIPRTKSGKIVELAVRNIVQGEVVKNIESLANPEALQFYKGRSELSS